MSIHVLSEGQPTPYGKRHDGPALLIGPDPLTLVISLTEPTRAEVAELRRGRLRVAPAEPVISGGAALMVWRFEPLSSNSPGLWFDTPFHIGLNAPANRCLPVRAPDHYRTVMIVIQDEAGLFHGGRMITLSPPFCVRLEAVVRDQALAAVRPGWTYDNEIAKALANWPGPKDAMRNAAVIEVAGLSRWTGHAEARA